MQSPQELLEKLDELLSEVPKPSLVAYDEDLRDRTLLEKEFSKRVHSDREASVQLIVDRASRMLTERPTSVFRICSIGCGDGSLDKLLLTGIRERFPHVAIHYCGCDINECFAQAARESLTLLSNVQVEVLTDDFQKLGNHFVPCDLVVCVNVLYYMETLDTALSSMMHLVSGDGVAMIVQIQQSTHSQLYRRFWLHEHQWPMKFADDVAQALDTMGIGYSTQQINGTADFSDCFKENFQDSRQELLLNFMTHTQISNYPPLIRKTCIDYLRSAATGKPEQYVLTRVTTVFTIPKK